MRILTLSALFLFCTTVSAQGPTGIKFEKGLSWAQLREKAKKENKYIFLDCFTTWCAPCKVMEQEVFTRKNVGDFFNASFINVKAQFDSTKNDNEEVRSWYVDVKDFSARFGIREYPTYLFFNPNGELVHKIIGGIVQGDGFLTKSKAALNPDTQYYRLKKMFDDGRRDAPFLRTLLNAAFTVRETADYTGIANAYLSQQTKPLTEDDMNLMSEAVFKISDVGFIALIRYSREASSLAERARAAGLVRRTVVDEVVVPIMWNGGKVERNGGMVIYTGKLRDSVNWDDIKLQVAKRVPDLTHEVAMASQILYFEMVKDWPKFCQATSAFINRYGDRVDGHQLNLYAWSVINAPVDVQCVGTAMGWMQKAVAESNGERPEYRFTEAALLYKADRREEAIDKIKQLIAAEGDPFGQLTPILEKMNKREKIF